METSPHHLLSEAAQVSDIIFLHKFILNEHFSLPLFTFLTHVTKHEHATYTFQKK